MTELVCEETKVVLTENLKPIKSYGICANCKKPFCEDHLAMTGEASHWPVIYVNAYCLKCYGAES